MNGYAVSAFLQRQYRRQHQLLELAERIGLRHLSNSVRQIGSPVKPVCGGSGRGGSEAVAAMIDQREELVACFLAVAEGAQHGAGHRPGVLLFHTAHHHAEMARFANYAYSHRVHGFLNGLRDLLGHPFPKKGSRWCSHRLKNSISRTTTISSYFTSYKALLTSFPISVV